MLEIITSGGWLMIPIVLCSIVAMAISAERAWSLQTRRICPGHLLPQIWNWIKNDELTKDKIKTLQTSSPLGRILAAGLINRHCDRAVMKEAIEEAGQQIVIELERFLNTLGTIAAITPLLGLLGTVIGMIKVFTAITMQDGMGNAADLAGGISEALVTTAAGLLIAIPSLMFYRYFQRKVEELVVTMEHESLKLVEVLMGLRERDGSEGKSL